MPITYRLMRLPASGGWRLMVGLVGFLAVLALVAVGLWSGTSASVPARLPRASVQATPTTVTRRITVNLDNRPEGYGAQQPTVHFLGNGWRYYEVRGDTESVWYYIGPNGETIEERVSVCYGCPPESPGGGR